MTIINGISDSIRGKLSSFEDYLKNFTDVQNYKDNFYKSFTQDKDLLKKKMNRGN